MAGERATEAPPAWTVAGLLLAVADALQARLGAVTVRGEISGFMRAASGHCYLTLKDSEGAAALLRCAMFRRAAALLDFTPADGQQVEVRGRIAVYEARGELQCIVESMQRLGAGSLYELLLRLRERLAAAGLFDATRKRPLPAYPRTIGVVTSLQAAALHDVLSAVARRAPQVRVVVYPSLVQGPEAPAQLVRALAQAVAHGAADTLIVCRGGGSLEDLWAFNDEAVVRALAACPIPTVCGIGHEVDLTLAELAADCRAPTPSAAAEMATPVREDEIARVQRLAGQLQRAVRRQLDTQAQRLDRAAWQLDRPARQIGPQVAKLDRLQARLIAAVRQRLADERAALDRRAVGLTHAARTRLGRAAQALERLEIGLRAADPSHVLALGYVWLSDARGSPVTSVNRVAPGDALRARWADGAADLSVQRIVDESG